MGICMKRIELSAVCYKIIIVLVFALALMPAPACAKETDKQSQLKIYNLFRDALVNQLVDSLKKNSDGLVQDIGVVNLTGRVLQTVKAEIDALPWVIAGELGPTVAEIKILIDKTIRSKSVAQVLHGPLVPPPPWPTRAVEIAVSEYLAEVLDIPAAEAAEAAKVAESKKENKSKENAFSYHRLFIGGAFAHQEEGTAKGTLTAALLVRSRLADGFTKKRIDKINPKAEGWYLDLLVDVHFITAESFNEITEVPDSSTFSGTATSVLLNSVRSSRLSIALVIASPPFMADYSNIGFLTRFTISTQDGSPDVFRRFEFGLRMENRSWMLLHEASAEFLFTVDKAPGSMYENDKSSSVLGTDRFIFNLELPLLNKRIGGLYAQFHSEWPIGERDRIPDVITNEKKLRQPPVYEFRFGATFDAVKLLKPVFGI